MRTILLFLSALFSAGIVSASGEESQKAIAVTVRDSKARATSQAQVKGRKGNAVYFNRHVMPLLTRLGCNAIQCHGSAAGKGGLRLSMFGADARADHAALTKAAEGRRINKIEPPKSLFLLKATASIPHDGGPKIAVRSPEYYLLISWIAQGAPWSDEQGTTIVSIKVSPEQSILKKGDSQPIRVTAIFSDGTMEDVTRDAQYQASDKRAVVVAKTGQIKANDYGQSTIVASYMRKNGLARVTVPQPLPFPFPKMPIHNKVDELVVAKLKELGIPPSEPCSDQEFLRRIYLDTIGTLPTAEEVRAFLSATDPQKRSKLTDRLLDRDEFADFWALKWGDLLRVKSEYPSNLWPNAVQAYHRWLRDSIAQNKPYDRFAGELLVSNGSNFRDATVNFYRAFPNRDPQGLADATALVFMGARIGCARCHAHPVEDWTMADNRGMSAFFAKVGYKKTLEWKEEIVYFNPKGALRHPATHEVVNPTFPGGKTLVLAEGEDPRVKFAEWLTAPENPWFARNIVNRIWFWLLGEGIVHEPDDFRPTNPPRNPELLAFLEKELVGHGYDLKHIYRLILNSATYQLSSKSNQWNAADVSYGSHYLTKRLGAEELLDAVGQVTETSEKYSSIIPEPFTFLPSDYRAVQLADGSIGAPFLELFGRPSRDSAYESERSGNTSMLQALHFINSSHLEGRIATSPRLKQLANSPKGNAAIIEEIYLFTLSRYPNKAEIKSVNDYIQKNKKARIQVIQDVVWAIMNTKEFMFNH